MPDHSLKKMLLFVALLSLFSATMQVSVFNRKQNLHFRHYEDGRSATPPPGDNPKASGLPVEGTVSAIGVDRIHLSNSHSSPTEFRCEQPGQYAIGQRVRITYTEGSPPQAIKIESLAP